MPTPDPSPSPPGDATLPAVSFRRRLDWMDTDAADRWHYSVVQRWAEQGEARLHRDLGIIDETFGFTPRVAFSADFFAAVTFDQEVEVTFAVTAVGRTSATYDFEVVLVDGPRAAGGQVVTVFMDHDGATAPWPDHVRAALSGAAPAV